MWQAMWWAHSAAVWIIRRLPLRVARLAFRIHHKLLRMAAPSYRATTYFGARLVCDPRDLIQQMILFFGVWEPDVSHVIERSLAPGDVFVDIGANVGYDSLLAARSVGPSGTVVAIEASARTFALLSHNLTLNDSANVRAVNAAVSDRVGKLELFEVSEGNIGAATTLAARGGALIESVDALPLDRILTPQEIARLRLIKLDIEGAEPPILRQILARLAQYPAGMDIIVEASPQDDSGWHEVFAALLSAGFVAYAIANEYELEWYLRWRRPTPLRRVTEMPTRQQDLLFTRQPLAF